MPRFGVEFYGRHAIVKLRVAVPKSHMKMIGKSFPDLNVCDTLPSKTGKFMLMIEGCIPIRDYKHFIGCVRNSILARKIEELRAGYTHHEYPVEHDIFTNDDLPQFDWSSVTDEDELPF